MLSMFKKKNIIKIPAVDEIDSAAHHAYAFMEKHTADHEAQKRYLVAVLAKPNGREILKKTRDLAQQKIDYAARNFKESPELQQVPAIIILDLQVIEELNEAVLRHNKQGHA